MASATHVTYAVSTPIPASKTETETAAVTHAITAQRCTTSTKPMKMEMRLEMPVMASVNCGAVALGAHLCHLHQAA